jgi:PAS domain S-box-containing protein
MVCLQRSAGDQKSPRPGRICIAINQPGAGNSHLRCADSRGDCARDAIDNHSYYIGLDAFFDADLFGAINSFFVSARKDRSLFNKARSVGMARLITPTNDEVHFDKDEIIVSKTDTKGRILYANQTFCRVSGFDEAELLGQPHSLIRHPDMPRAVFKLLWDTLFDGKEIFAYVKNISKSGAFYWVFAHVTPSFDRSRNIVGFHSNRRVPNREAIQAAIAPLYAAILEEERRHRNGQDALAAGFSRVLEILGSKRMSYDEFIFSL